MEAYRNPLEPRTKWRLIARRLAFTAMAGIVMFFLMKTDPGYLVVGALAVGLWIISGRLH